MSLRILILSRYDSLGASSRLRFLQYVPYLESAGAEVSVVPLLDNAYLQLLYKSETKTLNKFKMSGSVVSGYFRRIFTVLNCKKFDVLWVEKELFPFLPSIFESLLKKIGIPYVIDYDDAIFHNYDLHRSQIVRLFLGNKLDSLLSGASAVTAGNGYLAAYASRGGANNVHIIPTVVDINNYRATPETRDDVFRIGWIGSPSTAQYLSLIAEPLRRVAQIRKIVLVTIGAGSLELPGVPIERHDWSLDMEAKLLESIHVGVMPLRDSPWERGKCGYKLIQYMAAGRPVIASPVGVNSEIVSSDVGMLACNNDLWFDALINLADQPIFRQQLGKSARTRVEQTYSLQVTAPKILYILEDAAQRKLKE